MKRIASLATAVVLASLPLVASADPMVPSGPTPLQMLTAVANLQAQAAAVTGNMPLACAAVFSSSSAVIGQKVDLAWGSVGALDPAFASTSQPMWTPNGGSVLSFARAGTWTYSFTFYSASGATATCNAKIVVTK